MTEDRLDIMRNILKLVFESEELTCNILKAEKNILKDLLTTDFNVRSIAKRNKVTSETVRKVFLKVPHLLISNINTYIAGLKEWEEKKVKSFKELMHHLETVDNFNLKILSGYPLALTLPVSYFDFETRVSNSLSGEAVKTLGDLLSCTRKDLLRFRNMGKKGVVEIEEKLKRYNLSLKEEKKIQDE